MPHEQDQRPAVTRLNPSVARGPYTAKPSINPEQARQELAHMQRFSDPTDPIAQAEIAALRRAAGGGQPS